MTRQWRRYATAHGGDGEYFGAPSYVAAQVDTLAITKACKAGHGKTTRAAVRKLIAKTNIPSRPSVLGVRPSQKGGDLAGRRRSASTRSSPNGSYKRVG